MSDEQRENPYKKKRRGRPKPKKIDDRLLAKMHDIAWALYDHYGYTEGEMIDIMLSFCVEIALIKDIELRQLCYRLVYLYYDAESKIENYEIS